MQVVVVLDAAAIAASLQFPGTGFAYRYAPSHRTARV